MKNVKLFSGWIFITDENEKASAFCPRKSGPCGTFVIASVFQNKWETENDLAEEGKNKPATGFCLKNRDPAAGKIQKKQFHWNNMVPKNLINISNSFLPIP